MLLRATRFVFFFALAGWAALSLGAAHEPVWSAAQKERPALLDTLKELVSIESGSHDIEGLDRMAGVLAARLKALGGKLP